MYSGLLHYILQYYFLNVFKNNFKIRQMALILLLLNFDVFRGYENVFRNYLTKNCF